VRSITDYGVFIGIEEGVDGMVHKSDISWTAKVNNPSDLYKKGDEVEAIILSINHDEKKVSLGVKQLFDDPWPTIFNELPPGKVVHCKVLSLVDYGVFVRVREGIEGLIPQNDLVLAKDETGKDKPLREGDEIEAEIANIDTQERRLTLSMRRGETAPVAAAETSSSSASSSSATAGGAVKTARASKTPKKSAAAEAAGGTIGELIKQKLGAKLATISTEKDKKEEEEDGKDE
jgi:small subunit ribosomal protein S1